MLQHAGTENISIPGLFTEKWIFIIAWTIHIVNRAILRIIIDTTETAKHFKYDLSYLGQIYRVRCVHLFKQRGGADTRNLRNYGMTFHTSN